MRSGPEHGVTLVELIVVLALLGLILGVSGLALASLQRPAASEEVAALRRARTEAIRNGAPVVHDSALFLPDGRVVGSGFDYLTGSSHAR